MATTGPFSPCPPWPAAEPKPTTESGGTTPVEALALGVPTGASRPTPMSAPSSKKDARSRTNRLVTEPSAVVRILEKVASSGGAASAARQARGSAATFIRVAGQVRDRRRAGGMKSCRQLRQSGSQPGDNTVTMAAAARRRGTRHRTGPVGHRNREAPVVYHQGNQWYTAVVPTVKPRYQITETADVGRALDLAARRWPGEPRSKLLVRLVQAGGDALEREDSDAARHRQEAVRATSGKYDEVFGPSYLEQLRQDWPG